MEILSTAEKIKRARVYKGVTLKELCGENISISKMSCIENGKIKPDEETLKYISKILGIKYDYLLQDVYDQIIENLKLVEEKLTKYEKCEDDKLEKVIKYNLEYSKKNSYNNLSFQLTHNLFKIYLNDNNIEEIHLLISDYYDLFQKCNNKENQLIYYKDMANFFAGIKEYTEAVNYYSKIREILEKDNKKNREQYVLVCFYEGACLAQIKEIQKAHDILTSALSYTEYFNNNAQKGKFYHLIGMMNILLNKNEAENYIRKAYDLQKEDFVECAKYRADNGKYFYAAGKRKIALEEVAEAIKAFPKENKYEYTEFLLRCIAILYDNNDIDEATKYIDDALNLAIDVNDNRLVERAYYYKGMIFQKNKMYFQAEMYMNLSTDTLLRFANNEQRYKRYNEMAELYYNLEEPKESIKYFTLAVNLEKKI